MKFSIYLGKLLQIHTPNMYIRERERDVVFVLNESFCSQKENK